MKRKKLCVAVVTAVALYGIAIATGASPPDSPGHFPKPLASSLPYDVDVAKVRRLVAHGAIAAAHTEFDVLAWQAFIALNWPADQRGEPSREATIGNVSAPRVWEFWRPSSSIFLPEGKRPESWNGKAQQSDGYYWKAAWRQQTTVASNLEAFSGPLVDQNGNWVRYQMRVNREEFDYIYQNGLYSQDGQIAFSKRPDNNQVGLPLNIGQSKHGAVEIKLAWKELVPGKDDPHRFFTRQLKAELSEPPGPDGKVPTRTFLAGLVGMHISMRTQSSPEWIWSTFEQIDNVRQNEEANGSVSHPSFNDPSAPNLKPNVLPTANAVQDPDTGRLTIVTKPPPTPDKWVESLTKTPVQVERTEVPTTMGLNPLDKQLHQVTEQINQQVQALLAADHNSVFQYYELIDSQWPEHPNAPAMAGGTGSAPESITHKTPGDMVPVFLVNTTMETYFQLGPQPAGPLEQDDRLAANSAPIDATMVNATESCVGCHYSSGITIGFKRDLVTGKMLVDQNGVPTPVFGENSHFGKTGNASFSWMLQLEPQARRVDIHRTDIKLQGGSQ